MSLQSIVHKWRQNATEAREWGEKANSVAEKTAARERAETLDECANAVVRIAHDINSLATRKNRASDLKRYLVGDLDKISELTNIE